MDWPRECPDFCLVHMEGHQPSPWEKLHQLKSPLPCTKLLKEKEALTFPVSPGKSGPGTGITGKKHLVQVLPFPCREQ